MTFEYDLAAANSGGEFLLTDACENRPALTAYCNDQTGQKAALTALVSSLDSDCVTAIEEIEDANQKGRAMFATCYLLSVGKGKGENALDLSVRLKDANPIAVPDHILSALRWVTRAGVGGGEANA